MYAITAITGHVGGAAADVLLSRGAPVRAVLRRPDRAHQWVERGAESAIADFADPAALTSAFAGCRGAFVMLPTIMTASDADNRQMADTIAAAVAASGVEQVVMLSSHGADLASGTGPIRWLHHMENALRATPAIVTAVRAPHFQEKVETVLDAAIHESVYPVFGDPDRELPMVATADIGAVVAECLISSPAASEIVDLEAPAYTERKVTKVLGAVLGKELAVVEIPSQGWAGAFVDAGVPAAFAAELAEMYNADRRGLLVAREGRRVRCSTPLEATLRNYSLETTS